MFLNEQKRNIQLFVHVIGVFTPQQNFGWRGIVILGKIPGRFFFFPDLE